MATLILFSYGSGSVQQVLLLLKQIEPDTSQVNLGDLICKNARNRRGRLRLFLEHFQLPWDPDGLFFSLPPKNVLDYWDSIAFLVKTV